VTYTPAGTDPAEADSKQKQEQKERIARVEAKAAGVKVVEKTSGQGLQADIDRFLERTRNAGSLQAAQTYSVALADFVAAVGHQPN
jgi:hypothetical protein